MNDNRKSLEDIAQSFHCLIEEVQRLNETLESLEVMKRCEYFCDRIQPAEHEKSCSFSPHTISN